MLTRNRLRSAVRAHPDHNRWNGVSEDFLLHHLRKTRHRLAAGLDKVNHDTAMARPQDAGRNFHHSRKVARIANRPDAFRTMSHMRPKMRCSPKCARQRLLLLHRGFMAEALHVQRAVEMVASVDIPTPVLARHHDEKFGFLGTLNPQRQPEIGAFADRHRVPMFIWN
jgi:hypothetical protein